MASYAPSAYFDTMKVTRLICLGRPMDEVIPHFVPLVKAVIKNSVAWDNRNHTEEDLLQVGLMKAIEVVERFDSTQGNLFAYAAKLIKHALWSEARLRPLDHQRVTDEVTSTHSQLLLHRNWLKSCSWTKLWSTSSGWKTLHTRCS
jgi:hypothetical protein